MTDQSTDSQPSPASQAASAPAPAPEAPKVADAPTAPAAAPEPVVAVAPEVVPEEFRLESEEENDNTPPVASRPCYAGAAPDLRFTDIPGRA